MDKNYFTLIETFLSDIHDFQNENERDILDESELEILVQQCWLEYGQTKLVKKLIDGKSEDQIFAEKEKVLRTIKSKILTTNDSSVVLKRPEGFETWLTESRLKEKDWHYWNRYFLYLERLGRPDATMKDTLRSTFDIISMLGDPLDSKVGLRKGLVVGEVQSGKTANFNGVINRAIDAGYKLIIVFSGILDDLRIQTQDRIEKDVIGIGTKVDDPDEKKIIKGVGEIEIFGEEVYQIESITSLKSDFNRSLRDSTSKLTNPKIIVCKKNYSVISHLIWWIQTNIEAGDTQLNFPLLILDDEADNASLNNLGHKGREYASKINALIRVLLEQFRRKSYLGYTATPFANILQDQNDSPEIGWTIQFKVNGELRSRQFVMTPSLFPDDFIYRLKSASNYIGPKKIFEHGREEELEVKINMIPPYISDAGDIFPAKQKDHPLPVELPLSLKDAVDCFIIAIGVRMFREPILKNTPHFQPHFSMLVHVSLYTAWQNQVADLIEKYVLTLSEKLGVDRIKNDPDGIYSHFEKQWNRFFRGRIEHFDERHPELRFDGLAPVDYHKDVLPLLPRSIENIEIRAVNSQRKQDLKYSINSQGEGKKYIAVGGNRLSRGFTIEGLTTNYFLRSTNYYDALLQMGRWFGYRPGYADVCRLFIDQVTRERYDFVTRTVVHLEEQLDVLINSHPPKSPKNFQLKIRKDHDTLQITRPAILKNSKELYFSYESDLVEAYSIKIDREKIIQTWERISDRLKANADQISEGDLGDRFIQYFSDMDHVLNLINDISTAENTLSYIREDVFEYIREANKRNKLTSWRIAINMGNRRNATKIPLESGNKLLEEIYYSLRKGPQENLNADDRNLRLYERLLNDRIFFAGGNSARIVSASEDESIGLGNRRESIRENFLSQPGNEGKKTVSGVAYRKERNEKEGLLLLYFLNLKEAIGGCKKVYDELKDIESTPLVGFAISFPEIEDSNFGGIFATNRISEEPDMGDEVDVILDDEIAEV